MLLAGDIGGTKTLLGLFSPGDPRPTPVTVSTFVTSEHANLAEMIGMFLEAAGGPAVEEACFGVAGPVSARRARLTNVGWEVAADDIARVFSLRSVVLLNDLESMAWAVPVLERRELAVLQEGIPRAGGNAALIAAGTGLGEALIHEVEGRLLPSPSEGGHADYSPRTEREIELMRMLVSMYGRAEWEHVLSGPGLLNVHRFTHDAAGCDVCDPSIDPGQAPALITSAALARSCPRCVEALDLFVAGYGAEAGNLALRSVATGGLFVGGGIAPKILTALQSGLFMDAFLSKQPMRALLEKIPVVVILNSQAALLGAAVVANAARKL